MTSERPSAMSQPENARLDEARRLELSDLADTADGITGRFGRLRVSLAGDGALERLTVELPRALGLAELRGRAQDAAHPDEVLTGDDALEVLLFVRAEPGRAPAVARLLQDEALRGELRRFWLAHGDASLDANGLRLRLGPDAAATLREACALVQHLVDRFDANEVQLVPSEPPVELPTETVGQWLARRGWTPGVVFVSGLGVLGMFGFYWWIFEQTQADAAAGDVLIRLVGPLVALVMLVSLLRK